MLKLFFILSACGVITCSFIAKKVYHPTNPGPKYRPTSGEVWPKTQNETKGEAIYTFSPSQFEIRVTKYACETLTDAINRFIDSLKTLYSYKLECPPKKPICRKKKPPNKCKCKYKCKKGRRRVARHENEIIKELQVELKRPCENYPHLGMDESYKLNISSTSILESNSIWGIMYGLETTSQLFYISQDYCEIQISATVICDYPCYPHRGLLLDTSRHYVSVANILVTLDAMAMNKMNVFHWHIVDDQSFPYESVEFPELSKEGAFYSTMVYTEKNIKCIVEYARKRGIRVIPELDVPGHTRSWGVAHPEILTECFDCNGDIVGLGPMNPIQKKTYSLIGTLFKEVKCLFKDHFFHIGGDEVDFSCWLSNAEILKYMEDENLSKEGLLAIFIKQVTDILGNCTCPIVWQELVDSVVPLPINSVVQVWKKYWTNELPSILLKKYRVILSTPWYLDILDLTFEKLYTKDPITVMRSTVQENLLPLLIGGEACMWGEMVDDTNLIPRVWPRASAVAEVLWCGNNGTVTVKTLRRIEEHTCRMRRLGVSAAPPSGSGFCVV